MKPLAGGSVAVVAFNRGSTPASVVITWAMLGLKAGTKAAVRDLWKHADQGEVSNAFVCTDIGSHDVCVLKITPGVIKSDVLKTKKSEERDAKEDDSNGKGDRRWGQEGGEVIDMALGNVELRGGSMYRDGQFVGFDKTISTSNPSSSSSSSSSTMAEGAGAQVPWISATEVTVPQHGGWVTVNGSCGANATNGNSGGWWIGVFPASTAIPISHINSTAALPGNNSGSPFTQPYTMPAPLKFATIQCGAGLARYTAATVPAHRTNEWWVPNVRVRK